MDEIQYSSLLAGTAAGSIRRAKRRGKEYIVVPFVGLIGDAVIRPLGSAETGVEYVPAEVLKRAASSWNGRAVVMSHPVAPTGAPISANDPETDERYTYGVVYNARYEDNRLRAEMWLDPELAAAVPGAEDVIARALAGERIEVSVGAVVLGRRQRGIAPNGSTYDVAWINASGDHLATLHRGATGACSFEMGCGAPRVYEGETPMPETTTAETLTVAGRKMTPWQRLRRVLNDMLQLQTDFKDDLSAAPDDEPSTDEASTVAAESTTVTELADGNTADGDGGTARQEGDPCMCQVKDLAGRLIANANAPFAKTPSEQLEALGLETLQKLDAQYTPAAETKPTPETPIVVATAEPTEEEWLAAHPNVKACVDGFIAHENTVRAQLVAALADNCHGAYTAEQLKAKPIPELKALVKALGLAEPKTDFSALGISTPPTTPVTRGPVRGAWGLEKKPAAAAS